MMQSAEARVRYDGAGDDRPSSPLLKPQVRAVVMVVTDVLGEQPLQMSFVHRNDVIEQVAPAAFLSFAKILMSREINDMAVCPRA
jgi:hypothetical protein